MNPQIKVLRKPSAPDWTLSEAFLNGVKICCGVEDEKRIEDGKEKVPGETRIPNGIYEIELVKSPNFSHHFFVDKDGYLSDAKNERFSAEHLLIHVKGVPGFDYILWHWGNTDLDSRGCYIVGSKHVKFTTGKMAGRMGVDFSKKTYVDVYPKIFQLIKANQKAGLKTFVEYKEAEDVAA